MIKGVIFDADGTLLDSMPVWENLGELYLESLGVKAKQGLREVLFPMSLPQAAEYMIQEYQLELTPEQMIVGVNEQIKECYRSEIPLKEGVRSFLEGFREMHIPMIIATTGDRKNLETALKRLEVGSFFDGILTCTELHTDKGKPDIYLAAAQQMNCNPEEILVFEDVYHALYTAKMAGFRTVGVYDQASDKHLEKIQKISDWYLPKYNDFQIFWQSVIEE